MLGQHSLLVGDRKNALDLGEQSTAIGREVGMGFTGAWALGIVASATDDPEYRRRVLAEGEALLDRSNSHAPLSFCVLAIEASLQRNEWSAAEHYSARLEMLTRPDPTPWPNYFIARGRTLAAFGRGDHGSEVIKKLRKVHQETSRAELKFALPEIEAALRSE